MIRLKEPVEKWYSLPFGERVPYGANAFVANAGLKENLITPADSAIFQPNVMNPATECGSLTFQNRLKPISHQQISLHHRVAVVSLMGE